MTQNHEQERSFQDLGAATGGSTPNNSDDEGFPVGNDPDSPLSPRVNTQPKMNQPKKNRCAPILSVKTRAQARIEQQQSRHENLSEEGAGPDFVDNDNSGDQTDEETNHDQPDENHQNTTNHVYIHEEINIDAQADTSMLEDFETFCEYSNKHQLRLSADMRAATELMALLSKKRVPLNVYDEVFQWHLRNIGARKFVTRKKLTQQLHDRYNMEKNQPVQLTNLRLPYSRSRVNIVIHNTKYQIQLLLTDPRTKDHDYLFFNDNPFAPPPDEFLTVGDLNTGRAYRETYKRLIKDPSKQVLLPIIFYMDGAVTGQFDTLPIHALKLTLGIYNQLARDKEFTWRPTGYLTQHLKEKTQAEDLILNAEHRNIGC